MDGEILYSDYVPIRSSDEQFRLHAHSSDLPSYIVAPKDIMVVRRREIMDHSNWLLQRGRFEEALEVAKAGSSEQRLVICRSCIKRLLEDKQPHRAAALVPELQLSSVEAWQDMIRQFFDYDAVQSLADHIPVPSKSAIALPTQVYDEVLLRLVQHNPTKLLAILNRWPEIYQAKKLIEAIEELPGARDPILQRALAFLWQRRGDFARSANILLAIGSRDLLSLLEEHIETEPIQKMVFQKLVDLCQLDTRAVCTMLADHVAQFPIDDVVAALHKERKYLHRYLQRLFQKDPVLSRGVHHLMVSLYAEFEPQSTLQFLQQTTHYALEEALQVCRSKELHEAEVYLLGRCGLTSEALHILLYKTNDVPSAAKFVAEHRDEALWEELVSYALARPAALSELLSALDALDSLVDAEVVVPPVAAPVQIIRRLPKGQHVPGMTEKVVKVFADLKLRCSLHESCGQVIRQECTGLSRTLFSRRHGAVAIQPSAVCSVCRQPLSAPAGVNLAKQATAAAPNEIVLDEKMAESLVDLATAPSVVVSLTGEARHYQCQD